LEALLRTHVGHVRREWAGQGEWSGYADRPNPCARTAL